MNKKERLKFKKHFNKQEYLLYKKYPQLFSICYMLKIPIDFISRSYKRYQKVMNNDVIMRSLENDGYQRKWFGYSKEDFESAMRLYIGYQLNPETYVYHKYTYGDVKMIITKLCGFDKYFSIYYKTHTICSDKNII